MENSLYQWQEECLKRWLSNGARGMVQAVTGAGKTRLALCAVDALEERLGTPVFVKIVVPTFALMNQWARALREHLENKTTNSSGKNTDIPEKKQEKVNGFVVLSENKIGLRGGGRKSSADCRYMIYVINSARYELARQILKQLKNGEPVLLIADECHHYARGKII